MVTSEHKQFMIDINRIRPGWLIIAALVALVIAIISLVAGSPVVTAMGLLLFEICAVLGAILLTTPQAHIVTAEAAMPAADATVQSDASTVSE